SADQLLGTCGLPDPCRPTLAARASTAQSKGPLDVGTDRESGSRLPSQTPHPSSLAKRALCRQTPKVGAVCGKAARTDLCGGRAVMDVPTAIQKPSSRSEFSRVAGTSDPRTGPPSSHYGTLNRDTSGRRL